MRSSTAQERFAVAVELAETGIALHRQNLRRQHPDLADDAVDRLLDSWLCDRPPDAEGRPRPTGGR